MGIKKNMKWMFSMGLILMIVLAGCELRFDRADVRVYMNWREFSMTNAEGKRLVMDFDEGDYPKGNMKHGKFDAISQSPAQLFFDVPHSDRFKLEVNGGRFECSVSAEDYGGYVYAEDVCTVVIAKGEVSMEGGDGSIRIGIDLPELDCGLRMEGETAGMTVMTRDGSTVTIIGVPEQYCLEIKKGPEGDRDSVEGTSRTGMLTVDLSRVEENILIVTDGDTTTEYEVKKS